MPSTAAIDGYTGFCRLNEKYPDDPSEFRMVWVCDAARDQIAHYERHIDALQPHICPSEFAALQKQMMEGRLPIFDIRPKGVHNYAIRQIWQRLRQRAPHLTRAYPNRGRHWLRSKLDGRCSTETLHAMFGHWQIGAEPWSYGSCLDPILFRADLADTVPQCLKAIGWTALPSPLTIRG
jgi:hypothetical protein